MKKLFILISLCALVFITCKKTEDSNPFIGEYQCNVERRFYSCNGTYTRLSDTSLIYKIEKHGNEGLKFKVALNLTKQNADDYDYLNNYITRVDTFNGAEFTTVSFLSNVAFSIEAQRFKDSIWIYQEDGHYCTNPVYLYIYEGKKIK